METEMKRLVLEGCRSTEISASSQKHPVEEQTFWLRARSNQTPEPPACLTVQEYIQSDK
jgi:hypothetical protein